MSLSLLLWWLCSALHAGSWSVVEQAETEIGGKRWEVFTLQAGSDRGKVWMYTPPELRQSGVMLGLPGWKFPARLWEDRAQVSAHADSIGVRVALADMHTTVYESAFFPQSRSDRKWCGTQCTTPGLRWVGQIVLPFVRGQAGELRGLFGLSTGGRGAVLVGQHYREVRRVCAMSGTFALMQLTPETGEYKIHANIYGSRAAHPDRWVADDSVSHPASLAHLSALLIHGDKDQAVPAAQSEALVRAMTEVGATVTLHAVSGGGHDWTLWSGHLRRCLDHLVEAEE